MKKTVVAKVKTTNKYHEVVDYGQNEKAHDYNDYAKAGEDDGYNDYRLNEDDDGKYYYGEDDYRGEKENRDYQ